MRVAFWKMHGAGNDFILVDDRSSRLPGPDSALVKKLCARRTGIGADGFIAIKPSASADFAALFFNSDGSRAEMCGNGARCVARLAHELGAASRKMSIETRAGCLGAEIRDDAVCIEMSLPRDWRSFPILDIGHERLACEFVNTGVPHAVIETPIVDDVDVQALGSLVRHHELFAPEGTNVNFMTICASNAMRIRTYERGVEAETMACGTGATACALVAGRAGKVAPPVRILCAGGDSLEIDYTLTAEGAENVTLLGPACHVFRGEFETDDC